MNILESRITNHLLSPSPIGRGLGGGLTPQSVVSHMLCMQSQDRNQHLRAIASRAGCTQDDIIQAYNEGTIVRTRTQRGTIHVVAAQDVGWMTQLCASKTLTGFARRREFLSINDELTQQALHHIQNYLSSGPKGRKDIGTHLEQQGVGLQPGRLYHLLCYAGTLGLIVQGPVLSSPKSTGDEGFEQLFVLTSQRITSPTQLEGEQALQAICLRYFASHGPATIEDLQRRSGLSKTQIKQGIHLCGDQLLYSEIDGKTYYQSTLSNFGVTANTREDTTLSNFSTSVHFLAGFDERLLGYKDRSATVHYDHLNRIDVSRNGIFKPTVMINGETIGIWSIKHKSKISEVTVTGFEPLTADQQLAIQSAITNYQKYLAKQICLSMV